MKTSIIQVHDMLSVLTVDEVETRFGEVPGVASATVNYAAGNVTVRYDETLLEVADIKVIVHQRGQQSADELQPKHVSEDKPEPVVPAGAAPAVGAHNGHEGHTATAAPAGKAAPEAKPSTPEPAVPKASPAAPATPPNPTIPAGDGQQDKEAPTAPHQHP